MWHTRQAHSPPVDTEEVSLVSQRQGGLGNRPSSKQDEDERSWIIYHVSLKAPEISNHTDCLRQKLSDTRTPNPEAAAWFLFRHDVCQTTSVSHFDILLLSSLELCGQAGLSWAQPLEAAWAGPRPSQLTMPRLTLDTGQPGPSLEAPTDRQGGVIRAKIRYPPTFKCKRTETIVSS